MTQYETHTLEETNVSPPTSRQVVQRTTVEVPQVNEGSPQKDYESKKFIFRTYQIVWYLLGIVEVLLTFRIVLKLFGASTQSSFTSFIYSISAPLAVPFAGIFGITGFSQMVLEWSTLVAMAVYALIAYGIVKLIQLVKPTNQVEVENSIDDQ